MHSEDSTMFADQERHAFELRRMAKPIFSRDNRSRTSALLACSGRTAFFARMRSTA
jgi:hypothetical protein